MHLYPLFCSISLTCGAENGLGILYHLDELLGGFLLLAGEVEELTVVYCCLLLVIEQVSIGIGYIIIGSDGTGVICQMLFQAATASG